MIWEYFWIYKLPRLQLSLSSYYCGLFGLNGLETQKHSNLSINDTKWSCWYEKIIKFRYSWLSGLCLAFMTFVGLFHFSCNPWHLRRLLVCLKVISEQYNLKNCHQTKILKIDHCGFNSIRSTVGVILSKAKRIHSKSTLPCLSKNSFVH